MQSGGESSDEVHEAVIRLGAELKDLNDVFEIASHHLINVHYLLVMQSTKEFLNAAIKLLPEDTKDEALANLIDELRAEVATMTRELRALLAH